MLIATIFTACTYAACNSYFIDRADSSRDCQTNLEHHSQEFAKVWKLDKGFEPLQNGLTNST